MDKGGKDPKVLAQAAKHFEKFFTSEVFADIMDNFASVCELLGVQPGNFTHFYPDLKANLKSCQGMNLFKMLDERTKHPVYQENMQAANTRVTVVGAGPCGLRTAIEAQLLGARVTVIEKRTSFTRNNVLHLWPWVIEDLKSLGAKNFYPRFCTGTMNHISIRRLQCILLKTALVFGVEIFGGVSFDSIQEPDYNNDFWRISVAPEEHPVASRATDVLIGAEGKHVTVPGFRRKEFRGKLAIAITANFTNKRTTAEAIVDEISGVAFVYKQDFFNNLYDEFGIALENIVYYKDDTHYFVMTTKKHSLLDRKVLKKDIADPIALLSPKNVSKEALYEYIRDACDYCTDYQLPHLEFALNHHGEPDVALFDFTSMFASNAACHIMEKDGKQLMCGLVGDGLLEPFWPTGTGIARGFLGAFDTVWAMRQFAAGDMSATEIMAEREAILKLLPQTTPENITKDFKNMSIIPTTRYPNLPKHLYSTMQVGHLYNSDKPENADVPRFSLPSFKEVLSRAQLKRAGGGGGLAINTRIQGGESQERVQQSCDANANDFYQAMREKRKIERESNGGGGQQEDRRGSKTTLQLEAYEAGTKRNGAPLQTSSTTKDPGLSYQNAPGATLKEKIALRRAALEKENREKEQEEQKGDQKTILNDIASKAEFVRKMSQTFGYGMPSNAEAKPDTLTAEAEKCPLLIKSSNNRHSPRENNRKNAENLPVKREEPKQERVKEEKKKEEKKKEEKKKDKSKSEARKERTREKKAGGGGGAKPLSMQQLITQNLPASRERMVRNSDIEKSPRPSLHSSVAPVNPAMDIDIDPELDMMLAELELDEDFSSLGENEQKAWLESLFFMDTKHNPGRQPRDQLSKTKVQKKNTLRVNQDSATRLNPVNPVNREPVLEDPEIATGVHVNDKMKNLAQDFFKPKTSTPAAAQKSSVPVERKTSIRAATPPEMPSPPLSRESSLTTFTTPPTSRKSSAAAGERNSIAESIGEISGAKQNLQSLAQSYFQSPAQQKVTNRKNSSVEESWEEEKARRDAEEKEREEQLSKEEKEKASLVASFFGGTAKPAASKPGAGVGRLPASRAPAKVVERASFTPEGGAADVQDDEEEDDEIERLIKAAEKERAALLEKPIPAPPPRNGDNRALAMMKRLGNINTIMQGKKPVREDEDNDD